MIYIDEVKFYLEHVDPNGTAEEVARWMGAKHKSLLPVIRRKGHDDLADRMVRNAIRRGANVKLKEAS